MTFIAALAKMGAMKSRDRWEQENERRYSETYEKAASILEHSHRVLQTNSEIAKIMAGILEALRLDLEQGQRIVKIKRNFLSKPQADTFSGHMEKLGGKLEDKFASGTLEIRRRAADDIRELDHKLIGEFLKHHGFETRDLDYEARISRYEEIIAGNSSLKPRFYNLRRNLMAIVEKLEKTDEFRR